ncbi:peptide ABC transporter substrate-binding protein [Vagococcus sp. BWB3-3]|uniref:Peptide ABC transporter substrate-binding protein n=1 Tax=Vagococcus allomyrinae TaxID=2794353 RepID=A0A940PH99_9ENTE|nr:peptide ABC transporter substrate-binding protein [Vagococcus allomyrinae]MBP1043923.1 peptide ABC transporter substrate-binding protein [Vagococcus allomyrinae]
MKKRVAALFSCLVAFGVVGCGKSAEPEKQRVVNLMEINEISSMDSANAFDGGSFIAITQVMEGLYNLDEEDQPIPGVAAAEPEVSQDGLTYTVKLRENAKWSDGSTVVADDFVFAWQKVVDPEFGSNSSILISGIIKNAEAIIQGQKKISELGVKAVDDHTLEIQLEQPIPYFQSVLTFPTLFPQKREYVERAGKKYAQDSEHLLYNGPFELAEWDGTGQTWQYLKNLEYWEPTTTNVDKIAVQVVKETDLGVKLYENGELDRAVLSGEFSQQYQQDSAYTSSLDSWVHYLSLNQQKAGKETIFLNGNIRKALSLAIDKEHIVTNILKNGSQVLNGYIPAEFVRNPETQLDFRQENGELMVRDQVKARADWQLGMEELGLKEVEVSLVGSDQDENKGISEYLQFVLEEQFPGLTVKIQLMPEKNLLAAKEQGDYDILLTRSGPDYQDPLTFLDSYRTGNWGNSSGYSNQSYDQQLSEADALTTQVAKRWQAMLKAEQILVNDGAMVPLYQSANTALQRESLTGLVHHLFGPPNSYRKLQLN